MVLVKEIGEGFNCEGITTGNEFNVKGCVAKVREADEKVVAAKVRGLSMRIFKCDW